LRITNTTRGRDLATSAQAPRSIVSKIVGLLGRSSLPDGEALVLEPCSSVHTAFMRFPIDVLYVGRDGRIRKAVKDLRPFRVSGLLGMGYSVIELPAGTVEATGTEPGDQLTFEH
jgi:uncharacterized membrane protein (UPF0127 family)